MQDANESIAGVVVRGDSHRVLLAIALFFVWKDEKPTAAKWALGSALASIGLIILIYVILLAVGIFLG